MMRVLSFSQLSRLVVVLLLTGGLFVHCSQSEPEKKRTGRVRTFDQGPADTTTPDWLVASSEWADTVRWVLDSTGAYSADGLYFRMRMEAIKVFIGGPGAEEHPLWCKAEYRMRPIPRWELVREFRFDSVVFFDPVRTRRLPSLPMLSNHRAFMEGTLRTRFASDASVQFTVDLDEGQLLEPTAYVTWEERSVIITAPSVPVSFLTEIEMQESELELPDWGPGSE